MAEPTPQPTITFIERIASEPSAIEWGDVATWSASVLTGLSVLLALALFARERRKDEMSQASQFVVWCEQIYSSSRKYEPPYHYYIVAKNLSDYPVFTPVITFTPTPDKQLAYNLQSIHSMLANAKATQPELTEAFKRPLHAYLVDQRNPAKGTVRTLTFPPHTEREQTIELPMPPMAYVDLLTFSDSQNRRWQRNLSTGELKRYRSPVGFSLFELQVRLRRFLRWHNLAWLVGERRQTKR
jgi:hypothetical protein